MSTVPWFVLGLTVMLLGAGLLTATVILNSIRKPNATTKPETKQSEEQKAAVSSDTDRLLKFGLFLLNAIVFIIAFGMVFAGKRQESWWLTLSTVGASSFGVTIIILQIWHATVSIKYINLDQQAILLLFGGFVKNVEPGRLYYVPWGIESMIVAPTGMIEKDIPADPRRIWHGDATEGDGIVPKGYLPPVRVTFAPKPEEKVTVLGAQGQPSRTIPEDDAYLQRNTAEIEASYGWQVTNLNLLVKKLGTKNTLHKAQSQMDDAAIGTFTDIFSKITAAEAQTKLKEVAATVRDAITDESKDWGISIGFFRIKPFGYSHSLNDSVSNANQALQNRRAVISKSEGEKTRLINEGAGTASAEGALLMARARGEAALAKVAATPGGQYAMAVQATQRGLETARAVIVPQDSLFGAVAGIGKMMQSLPDTPLSPDATDSTNTSATQKAENKQRKDKK